MPPVICCKSLNLAYPNMVTELVLAVGAIIGCPLSLLSCLNQRSALAARFSCSAVDLKLLFKIAWLAFAINEIA